MGPDVKFCAIVAAKVGGCSEDCKFCAQSEHYSTAVGEQSKLTDAQVLDSAVHAGEVGADSFGIVKGTMTTIHSYTNDQVILDFPHKDLRRARAAALSMIPTSTGAAKAIYLAIPELKGKLDGFAIRVPTPNVSVVDLVVLTEKNTTVEEVNAAMKTASEKAPLKGYLGYDDNELVSMDFRGDSRSSIFDAPLTRVVGGNLVKVISWYDNEWGYSCRVRDLIDFMGQKGL